MAPRPAALWLLYLPPFVSQFDRLSMAPLLLPIADELGVPLGTVTLVATAYFFLYGAMQPVYGLLSDRLGRVAVLRLALVGLGVAGLLSAGAPTVGLLIVARALAGGLVAGVVPTSLVYVGDSFPLATRHRAISDLLAAMAVGVAAGTLAAGVLVQLVSWRLAFAVPAVAGLVLAVLLGRLPESLAPGHRSGPLAQLGAVLKSPWALLLIALAPADGAIMFGFFTYLAPALEASGQGAAVAGLVVASFGLTTLVCTRLVGRLSLTVPPAALIIAGGAMGLVGYLVLVPRQTVVTVPLAAATVGSSYAFLHSSLQTWATDVVPRARGTATALFSGALFAGAALATAAVGNLAQAHRFGTVFLIAAGLVVPLTLVAAIGRWRYPAH